MKYTQIASDAFEKLQLNAGILLTDFDPETGSLDRNKIFGATGGGVSFTAEPSFIDFGEDIDNVPANTKELKQLDSYEVKISGTFKTVDTALGKALVSAADVEGNKIIPRSVLEQDDFIDLWWVGDYSSVTTGEDAGFIAIHIINALSTSGFSMQSNNKAKGDFEFELTAHYSLSSVDRVPFELYIKQGGTESSVTLSALSVGSLPLSPVFSPSVVSYEVTTYNATNAITATASDASATVAIQVNSETIESGDSATWDTGTNTVVVTVTNGARSKAYTITVTKE